MGACQRPNLSKLTNQVPTLQFCPDTERTEICRLPPLLDWFYYFQIPMTNNKLGIYMLRRANITQFYCFYHQLLLFSFLMAGSYLYSNFCTARPTNMFMNNKNCFRMSNDVKYFDHKNNLDFTTDGQHARARLATFFRGKK